MNGRPFGPADRAAVVKALAGGAGVREAAQAAGFVVSTLYDWRKKCALFREAWDAAVAESARPVLVRPRRGRTWQLQRMRQNHFTRARKEIWLEHFAESCDVKAACTAAEISVNTVYRHRLSDPAFAEGWREAIEFGCVRLEAEAVAQRLAAMEQLTVRLSESGGVPDADAAAEFERVLKLLREFQKARDGRRGGAAVTKWSFDAAFETLEARLRVFGLRVAEEEGASSPPLDGEGQGGVAAGQGTEFEVPSGASESTPTPTLPHQGGGGRRQP